MPEKTYRQITQEFICESKLPRTGDIEETYGATSIRAPENAEIPPIGVRSMSDT